MADGDITIAEVRADVVGWEIDSVTFLVPTKTCKVRYSKLDASDNIVDNKVVLFRNVVDDPETPEDETNNEFTQLVNLINNNSDLKESITTAVKIKLGI